VRDVRFGFEIAIGLVLFFSMGALTRGGGKTVKIQYTVGASMLAGMALGGGAIETLHAQAKPPVYAIALNEVTSQDGYTKEYLPKGRAAILAHGGVYVAAGSGTMITGTLPKDRVVVLRFESLDAVKNWFNSSDYQEAQKIGQKYAHYNIIAVDGVKQ
jgi:uncharacterized protein (DUF1330 family)